MYCSLTALFRLVTCGISRKFIASSLVVLCFTVGLAPNASAVWYEASGQARIYNGNLEAARLDATEDAIKQAMLLSGAQVSSVQRMANGLLKSDRFEIRSSGDVHNLQLLHEEKTGDILTVHIRADIFAQETVCSAADYKKATLVTQLNLTQPSQAITGGIHDIGNALTQKLVTVLSTYSRSVFIEEQLTFPIAIDQEASSSLMDLGQKHSSQYVLTGKITDLSIESQSGSSWVVWDKDRHERNLLFDISILDSISGEQVFTQSYQTKGQWPYKLNSQQDVYSNQFWKTDFAQNGLSLLEQLARDIDDALLCKPAYGKIIQVNQQQITVNIGSNHGVKKGDQLTLFQKNHSFSPEGNSFVQFFPHPNALEVINVFANTAILKASKRRLLANIQTNDFVARR
jgi:hypothetical protein